MSGLLDNVIRGARDDHSKKNRYKIRDGGEFGFFFGFFFLSVILAQVQGFQSLPSGLIFTSL